MRNANPNPHSLFHLATLALLLGACSSSPAGEDDSTEATGSGTSDSTTTLETESESEASTGSESETTSNTTDEPPQEPGTELWRSAFPDWNPASAGKVFTPMLSTGGEVIVPVDFLGIHAPDRYYRFTDDGDYIGRVDVTVHLNNINNGMRGLVMTPDERLIYATWKEDGSGFDWVETSLDGSVAQTTDLVWSSGHVGVRTAAWGPAGLLVVSGEDPGESSAIAIADPDDLGAPLVPIVELDGVVFPEFVVDEDRTFMVGAEFLGADVVPTVWEFDAQGLLATHQPTALNDDRWFEHAAFDDGRLLLADNDQELWWLDAELTPEPSTEGQVYPASGDGWWFLHAQNHPAMRLDGQLSPLFSVEPSIDSIPITVLDHEAGALVVEFKVGNEIDLVRYAP